MPAFRRFTPPLFALLALIALRAQAAPAATEVWRATAEGGFSGTNVLKDRSGKVAGIVAARCRTGIVLYSVDGKLLWHYPMTPPITAVPAVGDIDGDGREEIVAADGAGAVAALDAEGHPKWTRQLLGPVRDASCPAIVDLAGDGRARILVGDASGHLSCFDGAGALVWRFQGDGTAMGPVLAADLYDTPGREIIVTSHDRHIYALSSAGAPLWDIYCPTDLFPNSNPILADTDGDGAPELYIGGGLHHFYRIDLATAKVQLEANVYTHINGAIAAADVDGDGRDEVIFGTKSGRVACYGAGGMRWTQDLHSSTLLAAPNLLKIGAGKDLTILFWSSRGDLRAFSAAGKELFSVQLPMGPQNTPTAGDFDGDGRTELVSGQYLEGAKLLVMVRLDAPAQNDPRNRVIFAGSPSHSGVAAGAPAYRTVPAPPAGGSGDGATVAAVGDDRLLSGANVLRFDVANPARRRLALVVALRAPDGRTETMVRHVRAERERVAVAFPMEAPGAYTLDQKLVDADRRTVIASHTRTATFAGFADDQRYLEDVFASIERSASAWRPTNPDCARDLDAALAAQRGMLTAAAAEAGSRRSELVAMLRSSSARLAALASAGSALAPAAAIVAWPYDPWAYFDPLESTPAPVRGAAGLAVDVCRGEVRSAAVNITNVSGSALDVRVALAGPKGGAPAAAQAAVQFRRAVVVAAVDRDRTADALPALDEGGAITVPAYETRQLWVSVRAGALPPGRHQVIVRLKTIAQRSDVVDVPLEITVHPLAMPRPRPLRFNVWVSDSGPLSSEQPATLKDLVDHGVTVFLAPSPRARCTEDGRLAGPLDFKRHDEVVRRLSPHGILLFLGPQGSLEGQKFLSKPWRAAFVRYVRAWAQHLAGMGLRYDQWALYPYDEPSTPYSSTTLELVEVARLVRQADPRVTMYTDPTSGTTMETVRMFSGLIDIWQASSELMERLGPEMLPVVRKVGREMWMYDAAANAKTLSCTGIYRWRFWYAWTQGLRGIGWWVYSLNSGRDLWDRTPEGDYYSSVYDGPAGPIPSKRWEVSREGIEDYELLWLLRDLTEKAARRKADPRVIAEARSVLDQTPKDVEAMLLGIGRRPQPSPDGVPPYEDASRFLAAARKRIIDACLRLQPLAR